MDANWLFLLAALLVAASLLRDAIRSFRAARDSSDRPTMWGYLLNALQIVAILAFGVVAGLTDLGGRLFIVVLVVAIFLPTVIRAILDARR